MQTKFNLPKSLLEISKKTLKVAKELEKPSIIQQNPAHKINALLSNQIDFLRASIDEIRATQRASDSRDSRNARLANIIAIIAAIMATVAAIPVIIELYVKIFS